jgi:lysophospholipase L1-like esterase
MFVFSRCFLISLLCFKFFCGLAQETSKPSNIYPPDDFSLPYQSDAAMAHYRARIKDFKVNHLNQHDIVFIGNSITEGGGDWAKRFNMPNVKNRGIGYDVTEGLLHRLGEICFYQASHVFILIGINDLKNDLLTPEFAAENILVAVKLIHQKSPSTKVYVQSVFPTRDTKLIAKIQGLNNLLRKNESVGKYSYLNIHPLLADGNDLLRPEYSLDGIHITEAGYTIWVKFLKTYFKL